MASRLEVRSYAYRFWNSGRTDLAPRGCRRDLLRDVHARDERAGRDPRVRRVVVAGRRLAHVERHAELLQRLHAAARVASRRAPVVAHGADDEFERRLDLRVAAQRARRTPARSRSCARPRAGRRPCRVKRAAARSTSAVGGSSLTNRARARWRCDRAVDGMRRQDVEHASRRRRCRRRP